MKLENKGCINKRRFEVTKITIETDSLKTDGLNEPQTELSEEMSDELEVASRRKLDLICEACDEIKAQNFLALDVRRVTPIADYFAICSGTSVTHIKSIADNVQDKLREDAKVRAKPQGGAESFWIILDYGDVILHIFDEATREFYDLERLWSDAAKVECVPSDAPSLDKDSGNAAN
jgi:ribosome-associated protein